VLAQKADRMVDVADAGRVIDASGLHRAVGIPRNQKVYGPDVQLIPPTGRKRRPSRIRTRRRRKRCWPRGLGLTSRHVYRSTCWDVAAASPTLFLIEERLFQVPMVPLTSFA
jgi:hypothetical protein